MKLNRRDGKGKIVLGQMARDLSFEEEIRAIMKSPDLFSKGGSLSKKIFGEFQAFKEEIRGRS